MSFFQLTRRRFLAAVSLPVLAIPALAQDLPPSRTPGTEVPPGQIEKALRALDGIVEDIKTRSNVPGLAVVVVHQGETVYAKGFGKRGGEGDQTINADTVFQLASVSKSIGATVVARQVDRGVVSWDSRMRDLLPWFNLADPAVTEQLTVGDLYSHRSGLPAHAGDDLEDIGFGRQTILERLRLQPLTAFRTSYAYTNFGLTAAAEAVAQASGADWADLSDEALFKPLGMTRTSARFSDFMARDNRAVPHAKRGDRFEHTYQRQPDAQSPAGGVSSSINDLALWMKMVLADGGGLISPEALQPAISPQSFSSRPNSPDERAGFYGYGFNVGTDPSGRVTLSHSGAFELGAATYFSLIPSLGIGIAVLSNGSPVGAVEAIGVSFNDMVQYGRITRDWYAGYESLFAHFGEPFGFTAGEQAPAAAAPAPSPGYCTGRYAHPYFGTVDLREEAGKLVLLAGPAPLKFPLQVWDGSTMVFDIANENAPAGSRSAITFFGNGPEADALEIELLVLNGPARFLRLRQ